MTKESSKILKKVASCIKFVMKKLKKFSSNLLSNPNGDFLLGWKTWIMTVKKCKICKKKSPNSWCWNLEEHSITFRNYTVTYCQTVEEVPWIVRPVKPKTDKNFRKTRKKCKFYQKIAKFCHIKKLKAIPWQKYFSVTYYQTLKDVFWPLRLERRE